MDSGRQWLKEASVYLLILVAATVTRIYGIGEWSLAGDEIFTIKHAGERWTGLVGPAHYAPVVFIDNAFGLTKWSLRLPTAVLGIVSFPAFYFFCKRTFDRWVALAGTVLLLVSDWHLLFSQYARYYAGVFLFGTIAYFTYVQALKVDSQSLLAASIASCLLGFLYHPTFLIVPLSCMAVSALVWWGGGEGDATLSGRIGKTYCLIGAAAGVVVLPWSVEVMQMWAESHGSSGLAGGIQVKALVGSLLDLINRIGIILSVGAFFGFYALLKRDLRAGGVFGVLAGVPVLVYLVGSEVLPPFTPRYIFSFFPLVITFAAILSSEAISSFQEYGLARYAVLTIVIAGMLPGFASYYTGKKSLDQQDAVEVLEGKYSEGDKVLAIPIGVNYIIGQEHSSWNLIERGNGWRNRVQRAVQKGRDTWIVAPSSAIPGVGQARESWLIDNAELVWRRHAFGYERAMGGMSIWRLDNETFESKEPSVSSLPSSDHGLR